MIHSFTRELANGQEQLVEVQYAIGAERHYDGGQIVTATIGMARVDGGGWGAEITDAEDERWSRELEDIHLMPSFGGDE